MEIIYLLIGLVIGIILSLTFLSNFKHLLTRSNSGSLRYSIFENLPISVLIYNKRNKRIFYANKKALELFGFKNTNQIRNKISDDLVTNIRHQHTDGHRSDSEFMVKGNFGPKKYVTRISFELKGRYSGEIINDISSYKNNVMQMRKSQEMAEKANRTKSMFLANMSHEIRTPMNAIIGISKMLLQYKNKNLTEKQKEGIGLILSSGDRLLNLINEILDLSKIEAGKMVLNKKSIQLSNLLSQLKALVYSLISDKKINFYIKKSRSLPEKIITDSNKLNQILINILGNAVKFTQKGTIVLNIHHIGKELIFETTDTGKGIGAEELPYIFDEFKQVTDNDYSQNEQDNSGTGLGLALCKKLVSLMGGKISATSEINVGTTITFSILFETEEPKKDHGTKLITETTRKLVKTTSKINVLVIDRDYDAFYLLSSYLQLYNCIVHHAETSTKGLQLIEDLNPKIIFLELDLPKYSGYDILRRLDKQTKKDRYIIVHSSRNEPPQSKYNYYKYLKKPTDDNELGELLGSLFSDIKDAEKKTILLVEDDESNVYTLKMMLSNFYNVITAYNGKQGVEKYFETKPDLVLMDIKMPVMDGMEALKEIKKNNSTTPVIAVTAKVMAFEKLEILSSGFDDFVAKPVIQEKILNLISQYI